MALKIRKGDTRTIEVTVKDSTGTVVNLTGGTLYFTVNATKIPTDDTSAAIAKTVSSFDAPTTGVQNITLSSSDTDITPGKYYYDAQFVTSGGVVMSTKQSVLTVLPDTTQTV